MNNQNSETSNIYATCVSIKKAGILLLGKSGSGKSDLALRLIENKEAVLVADDRTDIYLKEGIIYAYAPQNLKGLLEVRGVGIVKVPYIEDIAVKMAVELVDSAEKVERMPEAEFFEFKGCRLPLIKLYAFEVSAADKIVIKLKAVLDCYKKTHTIKAD